MPSPAFEFEEIQLTGPQTCSSLAAARPSTYVDSTHQRLSTSDRARLSDTNTHLGRRLSRIRIPNWLGKLGHLTVHRPLGSRSSMVRASFRSSRRSKILTQSCLQGHLHHWILDRRWRCPRPPHPHQEPHLHHLLRGRRHLRCHHVHCLLSQAEWHPGRGAVRRQDILHRLRSLLVGPDRGRLQPGLRCCGGHQRQRCSPGGRRGPYALR